MVYPEAIVLFVSLAALAKSGQLAVDAAVKIARATGLGELAIGFVLISVSTSLPEFSVAVFSVAAGSEGLAIGALLGSNVVDIGLIGGLIALLGGVAIRREMLGSFYFILLATSLIPLAVLAFMPAAKFIGVLGIASFVLFVYISIKKKFVFEDNLKASGDNMLYSAAAFAISIAVLLVSARFMVSSASSIAYEIGVAEVLIGGTIVAFGTSVPELAVALAAIKKRRFYLTLGDAIGSCMTNVALIFSSVLIAAPFAVNLLGYKTILAFVLAANLLLFALLRRGSFARREGMALLGLYVFYVATVLFEASTGMVLPE